MFFLCYLPGVSPGSIRGSRTGVFIGCGNSESYDAWTKDPEKTIGYSITGCARSMFANRISFFFDFKGNISSYFNWTHES